MAFHPIARGARRQADLQVHRLRLLEMPHHAGQNVPGEDHLRPAADAPIQDLLWEGSSQPRLEVVLWVESGGGRSDDLDPALKRQILAVRLVDLKPGQVDRLFGVEDQPVEIEDDGPDHRPKCTDPRANCLGSP